MLLILSLKPFVRTLSLGDFRGGGSDKSSRHKLSSVYQTPTFLLPLGSTEMWRDASFLPLVGTAEDNYCSSRGSYTESKLPQHWVQRGGPLVVRGGSIRRGGRIFIWDRLERQILLNPKDLRRDDLTSQGSGNNAAHLRSWLGRPDFVDGFCC